MKAHIAQGLINMVVDGGQVVRDLGLTKLQSSVRVSLISERIGVHLFFNCLEPVKVTLSSSHFLSTYEKIWANNIYVEKKLLYFDLLAVAAEK